MYTPPLAISTLAVVLIVVFVVFAVALLLGLLGIRARNKRQAGSYAEHVAAADAALEQARASDRGWERGSMETVAREALASAKPGWTYSNLHLVLVDDRPGTEEDRAHFMAVADNDAEVQVVLARSGEGWTAESVE